MFATTVVFVEETSVRVTPLTTTVGIIALGMKSCPEIVIWFGEVE